MATHHVITSTLAALGATYTPPGQAPPWLTLARRPGPGVLKAIGVAEGTNRHQFQIDIDGVRVAEDIFCSSHGSATSVGNNAMMLLLPFNDSMHVKIRDDGTVGKAVYWLAYEIA